MGRFWQVIFRQVLSGVFALAFIGASAITAKAQTYLQNVGVPPFTTKVPVENGFINAANGNLHLEIPLGSFPQRAGAPDKIVLMYDSAFWSYAANGWWQATNISDPAFGAVWGGWRVVSTRDSGYTTNTEYDYGNCVRMSDYTYARYSPWIYVAPDGTQHSFPVTTVRPFYPGICGNSGTPNAAGYASDGSGFYISITNYSNVVVYAPDGTILDSTYASEDSNGNYAPYPSWYANTETFVDTLGRTVETQTNNSGVYTLQVPNSQGTTSTYTVRTGSIYVCTAFGQQYVGEWCNPTSPLTITVVNEVDLPDGTKYTFNYDSGTATGHYGTITSMTLPTGGTINYTFNVFQDASINSYGSRNKYLWITSRSTPDGTWNYGFQVLSNCALGYQNCQQQFTVTKPVVPPATTRDQSVYTFTLNGGAWPTQVQYNDHANGTLATTNQCFSFVALNTDGTCSYGAVQQAAGPNVHLRAVTTTLPIPSGNVSATTEYSWDNNNQGIWGQLMQIQEWNFGNSPSNPADRTTTISYLTGAAYLPPYANILNRPTNITVTNNAGATVAQTLYGYDVYTYNGGSLAAVTASGHDASYGTNITARGNVTSTQNLVGSTYLNTYLNYDTTGQVTNSFDPSNQKTTNGYGCQNAYPTTITNPLNQPQTLGYDCNTGLPTSIKDANNQTTSFLYDSMSRPTQINYPDGGQTTVSYNNQYGGFLYNLEQDKVDGSRSTAVYAMVDGLGRQYRSAIANDESQPYDQVDTCYDADGRVKFQSYLYQSTGLNAPAVCSGAGDTFSYDGLDRVVNVTHSDGTAVTITHPGRATCVTDEGNGTRGVQRCSQIDAFGRVTSVCEITGAAQLGTGGTPAACNQDSGQTGFLTTYGYDLLNNLTSVSQGGYLNRTFTYDSLSRLLCASNPEMQTVSCPTPDNGSYTAGTTRYSYDNNGNVIQRIRPAPNQTNSAVTVTTTYAYDALNRLTNRTYSDGVTPGAHFVYDTSPQLGVSLTNPVGRLTKDYTDANNGTVYGYDAMGRVLVNNQAPPTVWASTTFAENYTYDFLGDTLSSSNGWNVTPFTLTYAYNRARRLTGITSSFTDSNHPATLFSGAHYNAQGSLSSATLDGGVINESRSYDSRLRLNGIGDSAIGTTFFSLSVPTNGYALNSNMLSVSDTVTNTQQGWSEQRSWTYSYDDFNRVSAANQSDNLTGPAVYSYAYDRFGNRWQQNGPSSMMLSFSGNNNRIDAANGVSYDAAGNVIGYHPPAGDTFSYAYDAEQRLISVTDQTTSNRTCYTYDANGRRVERTYNCGTVNAYGRDFLYDRDGHLISQVEGANVWDRGDVYAGDRLLATYVWDGTMFFNHPDQLGSARVRMGITGVEHEGCYYLPFGETTCSGDDPSPMHFTGQEHDSFESGLYYFKARHYSPSFGRFMSPDPTGIFLGNLNDPQQLNLGSYVRNNPTNMTDPSGLCDNYNVRTQSCGGGGFTFGIGFGWGGGGGGWGSGPDGPTNTPANVGTNPNPSNGTLTSDDPFGGETNGIPNGLQVPTLGIWGLTLPSDPGCFFGSCGDGVIFDARNSLFAPIPTCPAVFAKSALDTFANFPLWPVKGAPEDAAQSIAAAYAARHIVNRGLPVPLRSSIVRRINLTGEVAADVLLFGPAIYSEIVGLKDELKAWHTGACRTIWSH